MTSHKGRILLVDDDADIRGFMRIWLEGDGHVVMEAEDGKQAQALIRASPASFDLVLSDIHMPEMDGIQLAMECRTLGVRFVAMSGGGPAGSAAVLTPAKHLGAKFTLHKPFSQDELKAVVEAALRSA